MKTPKVAIILLNWNGKEDTLACLASLQNLTYKNHEVILVDNGSNDGSLQAFVKKYPSLTIVDNKENLGFAEGNNRGIQKALEEKSDYLLILNNDTIVSPFLIEPLLETASLHPKGAIIGCKILSMKDPQTLDHLGGKWNAATRAFDLVGLKEKASHYQEVLYLDYVCGCLMFFSKEVVKALGMFEKKFFLFWEEADFCTRAKKANIPVIFTPHANICHKGSASFIGGKPHTEYYFWRNRFLFIERNCTKTAFFLSLFSLFIPELFHNSKMALLKGIELAFRKSLTEAKKKEKKQKLALYQIRRKALFDYLFRRFGRGPNFTSP